jgi:hypothetical protein
MSCDRLITSATRLLVCAQEAVFERDSALIFAAAGHILERSHPGRSFQDARAMSDPSLTFIIAAAGEASTPAGRREELTRLGRAVPVNRRVDVLATAEGLLARVDPAWAWSLMLELVGEVSIPTMGIGLVITAYAERAGLTNFPSALYQLPDFYQRQLAADQTARLASLLPTEAASYLAAAAAVDPEWALEIADSMLQVHPPDRLAPALIMVAAAAERSKIGQQVIKRVNQSEFITVQANWTQAAAAARTLMGPNLSATFRELAPRVQDELDPGREFLAGLPLMLALAHSGQIDDFLQYAVEWNIPPQILVKRIFSSRALRGADRLRGSPALQRYILAREWTQSLLFQTGWWPDHLASCVPTQFSQDILSLTVDSPWPVLPGELADIIGWYEKSS